MLNLPLSILFTHFLADFLFQSDWMALNKSKHWDPLVIHGLVYAFCFYLGGWGMQFACLTFISHTLTDAITSRITSQLWFIDLLEPLVTKTPLKYPTFEFARVYPRKRHWFFVVIGLDQLIHFATLALTLNYLNL